MRKKQNTNSMKSCKEKAVKYKFMGIQKKRLKISEQNSSANSIVLYNVKPRKGKRKKKV